ncbi:ChaB protein [Nakamurella panacisegetis]|uniref:ChaB protein n=1 Tax=Nakamurella panacisegetis TaxID=1090615 RepID=A0A1H0SVT7_9ACTN|nr:ChaB family protein [Nakamurella panacisegetis]SDP45853.1 ChaB protein [Nakamurella panacisegetis]
MPTEEPEIPGTVERSAPKVRRTYVETLSNAEQQYAGDEERAHRTAWSSVKHVAEKVGDHWQLKDRKGPSDERSKKPTAAKRRGEGATFGGIDVEGNTRAQLLERAKRAGIKGISRMTKAELGRQLQRHEHD